MENHFDLQGLAKSAVDEEGNVERRKVLLQTMGTKNLQLLWNLTSPKQPKEFSYDELVNLMHEHSSPTPSETAEQNRFSKIIQGEDESISSFVADLKKIAISFVLIVLNLQLMCIYGSSLYLVCEIKHYLNV